MLAAVRLRGSVIATLLLALTLAATALAGCGSDSDGGGGGDGGATSANATSTSGGGSGACRQVDAPASKTEPGIRKPTERLDPGKTWTATVTTNCGAFSITLDARRAPKTAASFASLARAGFYDGLSFHRIAPGFVIQGGDPLGNGQGGPGYAVVEPPPRDVAYTHGVVAMAKTATDPDGTSGSQFFIVTGEDAQLPPQYALLGEVTQGIDVVDRIGRLPLRSEDPQGDAPVDPVVIERVEVGER
jgi:peptidyl-prolyl cis-trans isomerase B (cyclophilin B)